MIEEEIVVSGGKEMVESLREVGAALRTKKKKATMPTLVSSHEMAAALAGEIIPKFHHHLAAANIVFLGINKAIKGVGAKVSKANPVIKYLTELHDKTPANYGAVHSHIWLGDLEREEVDFVVLISIETFNGLEQARRYALVDHLLARMTGEENEESGEMKWKLRDPDVQEFGEVVERRGAWTNELAEMRDCFKGGLMADHIRGTYSQPSERFDPETNVTTFKDHVSAGLISPGMMDVSVSVEDAEEAAQ